MIETEIMRPLKANSSKSMLTTTLAPVVIVVLFWFIMSSSTTVYVNWLERRHQRLFVENIASIRACEAVQLLVWNTSAEFPKHAIALSKQVSTHASEFLRINQEIADSEKRRLHEISRIVFLARLTMLILGPLLGLYLGWRLAVQLHRSIARIAVTLKDAHSNQ